MTETHQSPKWVAVVDALALQALRTHVRIEFDLRAVLRSDGPPGEVLDRAQRILEQGVEATKQDLFVARALLLLHRHEVDAECRMRVAEQVGSMHMLLFARFSGWTCVKYFRQQSGDQAALEASRIVGGLVPQCIDFEDETTALFDDLVDAGIPRA